MKQAGSGAYTVANIQAGTGGNAYAGWSLTVAYSLATLPKRNLIVYTGYGHVDPSDGGPVVVQAPLAGLVVPDTGPVISRVGVVAFDSDRDVKKEALTLNSTPISNQLNPASDVFNSSVTDLDVAVTDGVPSVVNTLGVDIDRYQTIGALAAQSDSATTLFESTGDDYYPAIITLATNQDIALVTAEKPSMTSTAAPSNPVTSWTTTSWRPTPTPNRRNRSC